MLARASVSHKIMEVWIIREMFSLKLRILELVPIMDADGMNSPACRGNVSGVLCKSNRLSCACEREEDVVLRAIFSFWWFLIFNRVHYFLHVGNLRVQTVSNVDDCTAPCSQCFKLRAAHLCYCVGGQILTTIVQPASNLFTLSSSLLHLWAVWYRVFISCERVNRFRPRMIVVFVKFNTNCFVFLAYFEHLLFGWIHHEFNFIIAKPIPPEYPVRLSSLHRIFIL